MTGPEHYREAERLLSEASFVKGVTETPCTRDGLPRTPEAQASLERCAQVHATLALAVDAATWATPNGLPAEEHNAWQGAISAVTS